MNLTDKLKLGEEVEVITGEDTGTTLPLDKVGGTNCNYAAPSNASVFNFVNPVVNGCARNFVQYTQTELNGLTGGYPTVTGGVHLDGRSEVLLADTRYEMVVESPDGVNVNYWFNIY